ncbi:hypothetical protein BD410DRAFT_786426 [Rickenella mellea]|uniref:VWFA domain-containing protein n=1 Tax=Rickenella mellea TaxID=50990 RepID=A0A4Y7Q9Q1_9AGAM|nr:hypothetical protein BD410DRAFT_786426 [Rickenella mellea]
MAIPAAAGIVHVSVDCEIVHLPLQNVSAEVVLVDGMARVILTQTFRNDCTEPIADGKYLFPIPRNSSVCLFEMLVDRGPVLSSISITKDRTSGLQNVSLKGRVALVSENAFIIPLAPIPAKESVTTTIVYVTDAKDGDTGNDMLFRLPLSVISPNGLTNTKPSSSQHTGIHVTADIQCSGRINAVTSPSHEDGLSVLPYLTHFGRPSSCRRTIKFHSCAPLTRDFVLVVETEGRSASRCFSELMRSSGAGPPHSLAMHLSIVPTYIPRVPEQEYLFLIDRSSNMHGANGETMSTIRRSLAVVLRMLPSCDTHFNILSFGNTCTSFWGQSVAYTQFSLAEATRHVDAIRPDYGASNIHQALKFSFASLKGSMPAALFLMTGGQAIKQEIEGFVHAVATTVAKHPSLRVYTLGIGEMLSTRMCERVACVGNGECLIAPTPEQIVGELSRLVRAAKSWGVEDPSVDWGVPMEFLPDGGDVVLRSPSDVFAGDSSKITSTAYFTPTIQQSPLDLRKISASVRFNVFAIVSLSTPFVPKHLTIRGRLSIDGKEFKMTVPVCSVELASAKIGVPLIHTLSARRIIEELQERQQRTPPLLKSVASREKADITRLGEMYGLATMFTEFVLVDRDDARRIQEERGSVSRRTSEESRTERVSAGGTAFKFLSNTLSFIRRTTSGSMGGETHSIGGDHVYGLPSHVGSVAPSSNVSPLDGPPFDWSNLLSPTSPHVLARHLQTPCHCSAAGGAIDREPEAMLQSITEEPHAPNPMTNEIFDLIRLQMFDGSFHLDEDLAKILGSFGLLRMAEKHQAEKRLWATPLAVAYLEVHLVGNADFLESVVDKAVLFLREVEDFRHLVDLAKPVIMK